MWYFTIYTVGLYNILLNHIIEIVVNNPDYIIDCTHMAIAYYFGT